VSEPVDESIQLYGGREPMERVCFRLKLREEMVEKYVEQHKSVWPDMLEALSDTGWTNYSLFLDRTDATLIGYFETPNLEKALAGMAMKEVNQRWQAMMGDYFLALDGERPDEGFIQLENVFYLQ
jgi:L-rhamnose mutarotase